MKMDNIMATVYINYVRGTHSPILNTIASAMWKWWLDSHLYLTAEYLPEVENLHGGRQGVQGTERPV